MEMLRVCLLLLMLPVVLLAGVPTVSDGVSEPASIRSASAGAGFTTSLPPGYNDRPADARIAPLRAEQAECLRCRDYQQAKRIETQIQEILSPTPPQRKSYEHLFKEIHEPPVGSDFIPPDIVIQPGAVFATGADYEQDGTMWVAGALSDSGAHIWRSSDHGYTWQYFVGIYSNPRTIFTRLGLVIGDGDSNCVHLMLRHPANNGDVYDLSWNRDGSNLVISPVWANPDTVADFSFCRDYTSPYYLYGIVNDYLPSVGTQNAYIFRSVNRGQTWAVMDSLYNTWRPTIQAGAGSWIYLAIVPDVPEGMGQLNLLWSPSLAAKGSWRERNPRPDSSTVDSPVMTPAFTLPESLAVTWVAYHHNRPNTADFDVLALHSTNGCQTWNGPTAISATDQTESWVDLKNYHSLGNPYVNVAYCLLDVGPNPRRLYRQWSDASNPAVWHDPTLVTQSQPWRSPEVKPLINYSPGAGPGGGCVFVRYPSQADLCWNAPWMQAPAVHLDSLYFKSYGQPDTLRGCPKTQVPNPIPQFCRRISFLTGQTRVGMDPEGVCIYEVNGTQLRRHSAVTGGNSTHLITNGRSAVRTDGFYLYVPVADTVFKYGLDGGTPLSWTRLNITPDQWNFSLARDTIWCGTNQFLNGYACSRFTGGGPLSPDAVWNIGTGLSSPAFVAWDGTFFYVAWSGLPANTFKRFNASRELIDSGTVATDVRGLLCRVRPSGAVAEPVVQSIRSALGVSPNPTAGNLRLNWQGIAQSVVIYDLLGRIVRRFDAPTGNELLWDRRNIQGVRVSQGVYFVRLQTAQGTETQQIVLQ